MFDLYKKEIATFFSSAMGYLVVAVFLVATWLLLWVIPSDFNVIYGGYATLDSLFDIAPWIYLFLVPAISMRLIAEERRLGTLDLLLIRPSSLWRIIGAKFAAGLSLVLISIAPTFVYVLIVCSLGSPQGNMDMGGTAGSYVALLLLASVYMSIGVFTSSLTDNQIVAFVSGAALCALLYVGFDMVGAIAPQSEWSAVIMNLGIADHYASMSRGVIDSRDLIYFLSVCMIFISATSLRLDKSIRKFKTFAISLGIVSALCVVSSIKHFRIDLTEEGRYTLSDVSTNCVNSLDSKVIVKLYLDGELNPGFRRLKRQTVELCQELSSESTEGVRVLTYDPAEMSKEEAKNFSSELDKVGFAGVPVFETKEDGQKTRSIVYPYARMQLGEKYLWLNLLENIPGLSGEESLNRSIEGLEYKFTEALCRLTKDSVPKIAFLEGHGELEDIDVVEATEALSKYFDVDRGVVGADPSILSPYKVLIIAKPTSKFLEKDKYAIDQYVMRGGRVLWLVDAVSMTLDSLRESPQTVGMPLDLNIEDMLFVYGVRIRQAVFEDMNCGMIPISVPSSDGQSHIVPMPWLFGPLLATNMNSPVTRNVNFVRSDFVSPIDTVGFNLQLTRVQLLRSSAYARVSQAPVVAELFSIHRQQDPSQFPNSYLTAALLEEGVFPSVFTHRRVPNGVKTNDRTIETSVLTKMIFVADGDIIKNTVRFRDSDNPTIVPLGYDDITRQTYGNKDFIVNAVQYLADDDGLMSLRNRSFTLRLLDRQKISAGTTIYKAVALAVPLAIIALFGLCVVVVRRSLFVGRRA